MFDGVTKGLAIRHFPSVGCFIENAVNPCQSLSAFHSAKLQLFHEPARGCGFLGQNLSYKKINRHSHGQHKPHAEPDDLLCFHKIKFDYRDKISDNAISVYGSRFNL